jgi:hypothetical protein
MNENCLKVTLRAVVQNDSLPVFGGIIITPKALSNAYYKLVIKSISAVTVKAKGNAHLADTIAELVTNTKTQVSGTSFTCYLPGEDAVFEIDKRDAITDFTFEECNSSGGRLTTPIKKECFDIANVRYMTSLKMISFSGTCYGDLSALKDVVSITSMAYLSYCDYNNTSLDNLPPNANALYIQGSNIGEDDQNETGGNLYKLGKMARVDTINTNDHVNGSIESLVASFVENGRSSGTINTFIAVGSENVSFGAFYMARFKLVWKGVTKITATNVTGTTVWVKGATAEEIAAWQQAGKTVNIVE